MNYKMNFRTTQGFILAAAFAVLCSCGNNKAEEEAITTEANITNGLINAKLYLPDADTGYYRGVRFDWSGLIASLEYAGHTYIDQWFDKYDPYIHESVLGPMQEFESIDFDSAAVGDPFLKVGVGVLTRIDERNYTIGKYYTPVDLGEWDVKTGADFVEFTQVLESQTGYSYVYTKKVTLTEGKPELKMTHSLRNTGEKSINTHVYNHNFFIIDKEPAGPNIQTVFNFNLEGEGRGVGEIVDLQENKLVYLQELTRGNVMLEHIYGYGTTLDSYDIRIENLKTKTGIRVQCDKPLSRLKYWSRNTTYCPEPYVAVAAEPGQEFSWEYTYSFYTIQ
jgi:hypothetical protein